MSGRDEPVIEDPMRSPETDRLLLTRRRFIGRVGAAVAATSGAGLALSACGSSDGSSSGSGGSGGKKLEKVTYLLIIPPSLDTTADLMADAGGHFTKNGLDVTIEQARGGSPQAIQAMISGKGLLTRLGLVETAVDAASRGAPLVSVGQIMKGDTLVFMSSSSRKAMRSPADFRGATIGVPSAGGTSETTLNLLLQSAGIPAKSVKRQVIGPPSPANYALVKQGRIDGYASSTDAAVVVQLQNPDAVILTPTDFITLGQTYVTTRDQLNSQRSALQRYLRSVEAAMKAVIADKSDGYAKTMSTIGKKYDLEILAEEKAAREVLDREVAAWTLGGRQNLLKNIPARWQRVYREVLASKLVKPGQDPARWYTNELLS